MKKVVKFRFEEKEGYLSVVEKNDTYYALVHKDTPKIQQALITHTLTLSFELKQPVYQDVPVEISMDADEVLWVYKTLEAEKNLYFKQLDDSLCVIRFNNTIKKSPTSIGGGMN
ncbi:hypothetical protein N7603_06805 [Acholeplasma vituli]|uniref:Uncharacterized protein n=1 Tax=Paracholeplasma vituli TaxID=69473 RepID=A0ABT2Q046_9MOLU|nr:hypothetical protein [Paracholeplasma vituli]MCU0105362.1 hypothetical protein [Paracholeplasma vituli]